MASQSPYNDMPSLARCTACNATVIAKANGGVRADANTVCTTCGMTLVEPPLSGRRLLRRGHAGQPPARSCRAAAPQRIVIKSVHSLRRKISEC